MKQKSIFKQLLIPLITIFSALSIVLAGSIIITVAKSYENDVLNKNLDKAQLIARDISSFMDGAYNLTEELSKEPSIITMNTDVQTTLLSDCVSRNEYLELLYIQDTTGMQTARSSGTLADRSNRWWFKQIMSDKKSFISKSYYSASTNMPCSSIFFPMYDNDNLVGIFGADIKLDYLQNMIEQISNPKIDEYSFIIDGEGVVVAHPDNTKIEELYNYSTETRQVSKKDSSGNVIKDESGNVQTEEQPLNLSASYHNIILDVMSGNKGCSKINTEGTSYFVSYAPIPLNGNSSSWSVITLQKASTAMKTVTTIIIISIIVMIFALIIAVMFIFNISKKITTPILSLTELVSAASNGDFSQKANENINNELRTLAVGFNKMSDRISTTINDMTSFSSEVVQSSDRLLEIEENTDIMNKAVKSIKAGSDEQNTKVSDVVAKASVLEQKFSILKKQSTDILENVNRSKDSEQKGSKSVTELEKQNVVTTTIIKETYDKIISLEEQSKKIFGIIETINDISSETGLLSLNASIEAARAGEQGKGFAVVAESIGKLAQDSEAATSSIESIINELCNDINDTVKNIQTVNDVIKKQSIAVSNVQMTFDDFKIMTDKTESAMKNMSALVSEMNEVNKDMVISVEKIRNISQNTDGLTDEVAAELQKQLESIRLVSQKINDLAKVTMN